MSYNPSIKTSTLNGLSMCAKAGMISVMLIEMDDDGML